MVSIQIKLVELIVILRHNRFGEISIALGNQENRMAHNNNIKMSKLIVAQQQTTSMLPVSTSTVASLDSTQVAALPTQYSQKASLKDVLHLQRSRQNRQLPLKVDQMNLKDHQKKSCSMPRSSSFQVSKINVFKRSTAGFVTSSTQSQSLVNVPEERVTEVRQSGTIIQNLSKGLTRQVGLSLPPRSTAPNLKRNPNSATQQQLLIGCVNPEIDNLRNSMPAQSASTQHVKHVSARKSAFTSFKASQVTFQKQSFHNEVSKFVNQTATLPLPPSLKSQTSKIGLSHSTRQTSLKASVKGEHRLKPPSSNSILRLNLSKIGIGKNMMTKLSNKPTTFTDRTTTEKQYRSTEQPLIISQKGRGRELRNANTLKTASTITQPFLGPYSHRSQERFTLRSRGVGDQQLKAGSSLVSPQNRKPNFAQIAQHDAHESSEATNHQETTNQDDGQEVLTPLAKKSLNQLLARQPTQSSKTPVMKKSTSMHYLSLLESCCLMPQHTRSSEQVKLGCSNNLASSSKKDLILQKFRDSNNLAHGCSNYPRLEINDQSLILDQAEMQKWDMITSNGSGDSMGKCEEVPDEEASVKLGLKIQHTVYTMTRQNKRSRLGHYPSTTTKDESEKRQLDSGLGSKTSSISQTMMRGLSQVVQQTMVGKCTQSFADIHDKNTTRPSTHLGHQKMSYGDTSSGVLSQKTKGLKITIVNDVVALGAAKVKKNLTMFSTPKHFPSFTPKPLIQLDEKQQKNKLFKQKPSVPTSMASVAPFGDTEAYTTSAKTQTIDSSQPATICGSETTHTRTKKSQVAPKQKSKKPRRQTQHAQREAHVQSPGMSSDKSPKRAYFSGESSKNHVKVFSHSDMKCKQTNEKDCCRQDETGSSLGIRSGVCGDLFASCQTQSMYNFVGEDATPCSQRKSTVEIQEYASQQLQNKHESLAKDLTGNLDFSHQEITSRQGQQSTTANDDSSNYYHRVSRRALPPMMRAKTIDSFIERQQSLEKKRFESIESLKDKIFTQQTTSDVLNRKFNSQKKFLKSETSQRSGSDQKRVNSNSGDKHLSFLKRMTQDTKARKERDYSVNVRSIGSPLATQLNLRSPGALKNPKNTPQIPQGSSQENRSRSPRSSFSLNRIMQPIGHFSSSFVAKAAIMIPPSQKIQKFNNGNQSVKSRESSPNPCQMPNVAAFLQLNEIQESFLAQMRHNEKPGKTLNDKIMLKKLEYQLWPIEKRAGQTIKQLSRADFQQMLIELEMLIGPVPSQRDDKDAQEFLDLFFPAAETQIEDQGEDVREIQRHNREKFTVFSSLVKALLLHETRAVDQDTVEDTVRKELLSRVHSDGQYQDWLADKFFVFYLNRTRSYQGQGRPDISLEENRALAINHQKSLDSRYMAYKNSNEMLESSPLSDNLENKTFFAPYDSTIDQKVGLPQHRRRLHRQNSRGVSQLMFKQTGSKSKLLSGRYSLGTMPVNSARTLRRQKEHVQSLLEFGVQRKEERERQHKQQEEEEVRRLEEFEAQKKEQMARYPWIDEELAERKTECCERLYYDALRRLGLPLPEFDREPTALELLDQKFDIPSIYQAIQQGFHASLETFRTSETKIIDDQLKALLDKYTDLRVPQDNLFELDGDYLDDDCDLGPLPVLSIDLVSENLAADEVAEGAQYPTILLYELDMVVERLQAYLELHPMSTQTKMNVLNHIAFKLEHLHS